jgi:hypothetical protein
MALANILPRFRPNDSNTIDRATGFCRSAKQTAGTMISTSNNLFARRESNGDFDRLRIWNLPTATAEYTPSGIALSIPLLLGAHCALSGVRYL